MLRKAGPDDAGLIAAWLNSTDNRSYLAENLRHGQLSEAVIKVASRRKDQAWYLYANDDSPTTPAAGLVALDHVEPIDGVANLWYVLGNKSFAGQGLTTRSIVEFCELNPLALEVAVAWAAEANLASIRCLEKAGFDPVGTIPNAFLLSNGRRCARKVYCRPFGKVIL